jgi:hypothetical protein
MDENVRTGQASPGGGRAQGIAISGIAIGRRGTTLRAPQQTGATQLSTSDVFVAAETRLLFQAVATQ